LKDSFRFFYNVTYSMAKEKKEKVIESVSLKNPSQDIDLPRVGMKITAENLTIERYEKLIAISPEFKDLFIVKLKNKEDEQPKMDS
jgi:hypothetical protein